MTTKINVIDSAIPVIAGAVAEWKSENTEEVLKKRVHDMLDKSSQEIIMKLLGFNDSWGRWKLDHCNGRSGNSPAGDYIKSSQQTAVAEWLKTVAMPEISEALKKSLIKEASADYKATLQHKLREYVKQRANHDAALLLSDLIQSKQITNYLAAMQLVSGEGNAS